ncbi:hypothetical protein GCM10009836_01720 [Pseudonocardia ailaonensis]|uniref:Amidohydrolase-related domain-containing protein n=2 Tax=Pseudonocardia ailaonensis TaxID=367279 RepID=A0ABN2MIG8_9PSEU
MIFSSDGHATAKMDDWAPYLPQRSQAEFAEFCKLYKEVGSKNFEPKALSVRLKAEIVEDWKNNYIETGRLDGDFDPQKRLAELDSEGIAAEVLFPDFGLPFDLLSPTASGAAGRGDLRTPEQIEDGNTAFNRWLAEFVSVAPHRWAGMAKVSFEDVDATMAEIRWAKEHGLRGIILPHFDDDVPLYDPLYDPIWSLLEELDMVANCHSGMSSTTRRRPKIPKAAHPACAQPLLARELMFVTQQILTHMIWGGVLEKHPRLKVVLTEMGTGWVATQLRAMDYSFEGSYLRRDVRDVVSIKPSEYFARQVFVGSSIFSRAEVEARAEIGPEKMMLGMDFPHHEGTLYGAGTKEYLRATLGAARVPEEEARLMLGTSAADVFGLDQAKLAEVGDRVGPEYAEILTPPETNKYPLGDVHKPLVGV